MPKTGKKRPKGAYQGKSIDPAMRECIRQSFLVLGSKAEVARQFKITEYSVAKILKEGLNDKENREQRLKSAAAIAGKVHGKVHKILDSIDDKDLDSGYIESEDRNGVKRKIAYGPSLLQKTTAGAIWTDKLKILADYEKALAEDTATGHLPLPNEVGALVSGIRSKIKQISVLNVQFEQENPDLSQKAQDMLAQAEIIAAAGPVEAEIIDSSERSYDFDNPNTDNGSGSST
jgi:hypothetical protein